MDPHKKARASVVLYRNRCMGEQEHLDAFASQVHGLRCASGNHRWYDKHEDLFNRVMKPLSRWYLPMSVPLPDLHGPPRTWPILLKARSWKEAHLREPLRVDHLCQASFLYAHHLRLYKHNQRGKRKRRRGYASVHYSVQGYEKAFARLSAFSIQIHINVFHRLIIICCILVISLLS